MRYSRNVESRSGIHGHTARILVLRFIVTQGSNKQSKLGAGIAQHDNGRQYMSTLQRCLNYLDAHGIRYAHTTHSPAYTAEEVAAAEHAAAPDGKNRGLPR